jgi:hypothetical protein
LPLKDLRSFSSWNHGNLAGHPEKLIDRDKSW